MAIPLANSLSFEPVIFASGVCYKAEQHADTL